MTNMRYDQVTSSASKLVAGSIYLDNNRGYLAGLQIVRSSSLWVTTDEQLVQKIILTIEKQNMSKNIHFIRKYAKCVEKYFSHKSFIALAYGEGFIYKMIETIPIRNSLIFWVTKNFIHNIVDISCSFSRTKSWS